ncbi:MAG TPA: sialate O-acetylesterase [Holophaga sp.]|jgi:sialate O-acetylesterase|nr:sialate O-acetylesterase [Holophaga sp.]
MKMRMQSWPMGALQALAILAWMAVPARAEVRPHGLLADHMVIQRGLPVHVWGFADAGEKVSASFRGAQKSTQADALGQWSLYLPACEAGGPFSLEIKGTNTIRINDVLVGDVWVASGQSNMEFALRQAANAEAEIAKADQPRIRFFHVERTPADYPQLDVKARSWAPCSPEVARHASAVAYFFAREIQQKTGVPIGVVESYWGGTGAEAWTSLGTLAADASLMPLFASRARTAEREALGRLAIAKENADRERAVLEAKAEGRPIPADTRPWHPDFASWAPAALYNGMIAPLTGFPIKGVIWYQGESNTALDRVGVYDRLFPALIRDWRRAWGFGDFPFLFVQIANWQSGAGEDWPALRDAQRRTLSVANTAMVVTIDVGNPADIHPTNKQDVGARLALAARATVYGEHVEYAGPMFRQAYMEDGAMRVCFDHAASGLMAKDGVAKGGALTGFEVAGADRKFVPAKAEIDGTTLRVSSPQVPEPRFIRYGWASSPECNLYNREGLPASPFQSEE